MQPQHETPVAARHRAGDELGGEAGQRCAAAEGGGEEGGCGDGGGEGEEEADEATHGSWAEPGPNESLSFVRLRSGTGRVGVVVALQITREGKKMLDFSWFDVLICKFHSPLKHPMEVQVNWVHELRWQATGVW